MLLIFSTLTVRLTITPPLVGHTLAVVTLKMFVRVTGTPFFIFPSKTFPVAITDAVLAQTIKAKVSPAGQFSRLACHFWGHDLF